MKTISGIIMIIICPIFTFGQNNVFAEATVIHASSNGLDISKNAKANSEVLVFYTSNNDGLIYMSNIWLKTGSQSYGEISSVKKTKTTTSNSYKAEILNFKWHYINTYDAVEGYAKVKLTKIYKPEGIAFIMEIFPENNDRLVYSGFLKGELSL